VEDTGRGLSEPEKQLLFARFSQASPRTHINYGGSGLGLFISRKLSEMHGGAIGFASNSGSGSTFSFYVRGRKTQGLPIGQGSSSAIPPVLQRQTSMLARGPAEKKIEDVYIGPIRRPSDDISAHGVMHILVVEDNLVNQRVLAKQLRNLGMKIAVANHGGEALEYIRNTKYCIADGNDLSLILMDWEMPVMDGLTCVRNIRQWQRNGTIQGHIPVIAVTANVRSQQVEVAIDAGMDDVVSKPFRIPELCDRMRRIVSRTDD